MFENNLVPMSLSKPQEVSVLWYLFQFWKIESFLLLVALTIKYYLVLAALFLESEDPKKDIYMYINSPGGVITSGLSILDTMNYLKCDVSTVCLVNVSMGAVLLANGADKKRFALPNSRVMIHQPLGGARGQTST